MQSLDRLIMDELDAMEAFDEGFDNEFDDFLDDAIDAAVSSGRCLGCPLRPEQYFNNSTCRQPDFCCAPPRNYRDRDVMGHFVFGACDEWEDNTDTGPSDSAGERYRQQIDRIAQSIVRSWLLPPSVQAVQVIGHTDGIGDLNSKRTLGLERARCVAVELVKTIRAQHNFKPEFEGRLRTLILPIGSCGDTRKEVSPERVPADRARNRRVEIFLYSYRPRDRSQQVPSSPQPTLRFGSRGPAVRELQMRLNQWLSRARYVRIPRLAVNGIFDRITTAAVQAFQRDRRLTVDGIVGPQTWRQLLSTISPVRGRSSAFDAADIDEFIWPWNCGLGCTRVRDEQTGIVRCEKFPGSGCTRRCEDTWLGCCCVD